MSYASHNSGLPTMGTHTRVGNRSRGMAIGLAFFLGGIGVHRFYLNCPLSGIFYALFCWTFIPALLALIECIILLCTGNNSFDQKYNYTKTRY